MHVDFYSGVVRLVFAVGNEEAVAARAVYRVSATENIASDSDVWRLTGFLHEAEKGRLSSHIPCRERYQHGGVR